MSYEIGSLVRAKAGRDADKIFWVVGREEPTGRLLLADGKRRRAGRPKAKSERHVENIAASGPPSPVTQALQQGETVSDRELRRAIAAFKEEMSLGKG